jgi:tetratricopeptide (TPR) repeat protein
MGSQEFIAMLERLFKAFIFVPCMALIAWWLFSAWLDPTLTLGEGAVGIALLAGAFLLGVISIVSGGWGFLGILALIYVLLLALVVWEYVYWRRREREHWRDQIERYQEAIARDPLNAAAYSFLGHTHLALGSIDEAVSALEQALALDPRSDKDRRLLRRARELQERILSRRRRPPRGA